MEMQTLWVTCLFKSNYLIVFLIFAEKTWKEDKYINKIRNCSENKKYTTKALACIDFHLL